MRSVRMRTEPARAGGTTALRAPGPAGATLTDRAYSTLEEMIVTLELAPGSTVSEAELSQLLGIGRTPIREALQRLSREKLVQILPRRGVIVSDINVKRQLGLIEVRRELERLVSRSATRRAQPHERARFAALASRFRKAAEANDDVGFIRTDNEFNELTITTARNEFAAAAMRLMQPLSRRFWYMHYKQAADMPVTANLHAAIADAIALGDEAAAAHATDSLIDHIESFTRATIDTDV